MISKLSLLTYPHPILKAIASPVVVFDNALTDIVKQLFDLMYHQDEEGTVGLAAPQVGLSLRMFVLDVSTDQNSPLCLINPTIIEQIGECQSEEACLSLPDVFAKIKRAKTITVTYQNEQGEHKSLTANDLMSNVIQHEIDHLNGVLLLDKLSKLKRMMALKRMEKMQRIGN